MLHIAALSAVSALCTAPYSVLSLMPTAPARSALREVRMGMEMSTMPAPVQPYFIRNCSSMTYHSLAPWICGDVMTLRLTSAGHLVALLHHASVRLVQVPQLHLVPGVERDLLRVGDDPSEVHRYY